MSNSVSRFLEGLIVGGIFGYLFGIVSAPKTGADLRKQIADGSEDLYRQASESLTDLKEKTGHTIQDLQCKSSEALKRASASVKETKDQLATKLDELTGQGAQVLAQGPRDSRGQHRRQGQVDREPGVDGGR